MRKHYRGYEISAERDQAMGGWENVYFTIFRESDGLCVEDSFTGSDESVRDVIKNMESRVDKFIETKGASECLEDEY